MYIRIPVWLHLSRFCFSFKSQDFSLVLFCSVNHSTVNKFVGKYI